MKRKVFTFEETDLEWINQLILEWVNENEGKKGGELLTELLKEYKITRKNLTKKTKPLKEAADHSSKNRFVNLAYTKKVFDGSLIKLKLNLSQWTKRIKEKSESLVEKIRSFKFQERASKVTRNTYEKVKTQIERLSESLRDIVSFIRKSITRNE